MTRRRSRLASRAEPEIAIGIVVRNSLRVAPLMARELQERDSARGHRQICDLDWLHFLHFSGDCDSVGCRKISATRASFADEADRAADEARAADNYDLGSAALVVVDAAAASARAVLLLTRAALAAANNKPAVAKFFSEVLAGNVAASIAVAGASYSPIWEEVRSDILSMQRIGVPAALELPLWSLVARDGRGSPGPILEPPCQAAKIGRSGTPGMSSACAADPAGRPMS